ncbi:MAG: hypothetical protein A2V88_16955 [Elusimicrobia bacterium RBG_16_66_12]|nr:MAG: hypothetical protein A2V88_16955 [Elusimicrobia bacterium RBG_16_66_12]
MKNEYYQQGDVIIERVEVALSGKPVPPEGGRLILAKGEATGHAHAIEDIAGVALVNGPDGNLYLMLPGKRSVVHDEHKTIVIPAGLYRVRKVQEYDHFDKEARPVMD